MEKPFDKLKETKMKKTILIVAIVALALAALGAGVAFAQGTQPTQPYNPGTMMGGRGGYGPTHDYVEKALAEKLGLTETQVEDALASGITMYQLALDNGVAEADLTAFMTEVHTAAFAQAVADGVMTQEQADWMLQRMQGMFANGYGTGSCPMGGTAPQDGTGFQGRHGGGMMGGGRWQQTQP
jgi:hypothetical protein